MLEVTSTLGGIEGAAKPHTAARPAWRLRGACVTRAHSCTPPLLTWPPQPPAAWFLVAHIHMQRSAWTGAPALLGGGRADDKAVFKACEHGADLPQQGHTVGFPHFAGSVPLPPAPHPRPEGLSLKPCPCAPCRLPPAGRSLGAPAAACPLDFPCTDVPTGPTGALPDIL